MEALQWYTMGIISMLAVNGMVYIHMVIKPQWYTIPLLVCGVFGLLMGLAWSGSSWIEGYPRSSALGLTLICGPSLLWLAAVWRGLVMPEWHLRQEARVAQRATPQSEQRKAA